MHVIQLTLGEILLLKNEIYGSFHPVSGEVMQKGLVNQNISIKLKYWLNVLGETVNREDKIVKELYNDLGFKYGQQDENGNMVIQPYMKIEDGVDEENNLKYTYLPNSGFLEFQKEYSNLLETSKEIQYTPFKLSEIENLTFEENYPIFNKFIINDKEI
jgi:hypothetical protein